MAALLFKRENDDEDEDYENHFKQLVDNLPEPDLIIENQTVYLKRPWIQSLLSRSFESMKQKHVLSDEEKAQRAEKRRLMEIERKKALKATAKRLKQKKLAENQEEESQDQVDISFILKCRICD